MVFNFILEAGEVMVQWDKEAAEIIIYLMISVVSVQLTESLSLGVHVKVSKQSDPHNVSLHYTDIYVCVYRGNDKENK